MKRLSIFLLALAFAVTFAVPAMAVHEGSLDTGPPPPGMEEGWAMYGDYTIDGEIYDQGASESKWYDDEFQFVIKVDRGPVTATVDFEISDDEFFEGSTINPGSNTAPAGSHDGRLDHLLDNYFIEYDAGARVEGLGVKIGEYGNSFGRKVAIYSEGGHQIGFKYAADFGDLGFYIGKISEGTKSADDDEDMLTFTANLGKSIDFFKKLNFIIISVTDDGTTNGDYGYTGFDASMDLGPVPVNLEWGNISNDDPTLDGGTFIYADFGLDEFVGFDLNIEYFTTNEEFSESTFGANDYYPLMIWGFRDDPTNVQLEDVNMLMLSASYKASDLITLKGKILAMGEYGLNDDDIGTEIDVHVVFAWAGNVSSTLTYADWDGGDFTTESATDLRLRTVFKF